MEFDTINGLLLAIKPYDCQAQRFIDANFEGTGGVFFLSPPGKVGFDQKDIILACANDLEELISILKPLTTHQRRLVAQQVWSDEKIPDDLHWHLCQRSTSDDKPLIELVVATRNTMGMLTASYHCRWEKVFK